MREIKQIRELKATIGGWRARGESIGLVPTMGNLHDGHLSLVREAANRVNRIVVSIFVNPLQFAPGTDYDQYPRTLKDDCALLEPLGVDLLFIPDAVLMYPKPLADLTKVVVPDWSTTLCGEFRPGHFEGVTTVVAKLFNLVHPDVAIFGEKDFQQLRIIQRMVEDLNMPVQVIGCPTLRETDGLAMSSRNQYLSDELRSKAAALFRILEEIKSGVMQGDTNFAGIEADGMKSLKKAGFRPDYVSIRDQDLQAATLDSKHLRVFAAAWMGKARLIDNIAIR